MRSHRDGVRLAYEDSGNGEPPLLLIHGWGTDRSLFGPMAARARRDRRIVAMDLRGFGASDAASGPYTIGDHADDVALLAAQLGLGPAVVIGHSMGGMIALDVAARYPGQVAATLLLEAMVVAPAAIEGLRSILAGVKADDYREFVARLMTYLTGPRFDPERRNLLVRGVLEVPQHVLIAAMEAIIAFDSVAAAARVTSPLLYVGTDVPYVDEERFRALCPQLQIERLPGCSHYFPLEAPDQLLAVLEKFSSHLRLE